MKKKNKHARTTPAGASQPAREGTVAPAATARRLTEEAEPTATRTGVPVALIVVLGLLLYWGDMYVMENGADLMGKTGSFPAQVYFPLRTYQEVDDRNPKSEIDEKIARGRRIFRTYCVACHQEDGRGNAANFFPPLAGSEWVLAEGPNRIIRIVLNGLKGPITVGGREYGSAEMQAWRESITDDADLAALLTYIRQDWNNKASEVMPEQVKPIREETKDRGTLNLWTVPELLGFPEK